MNLVSSEGKYHTKVALAGFRINNLTVLGHYW